MNVKAVIYCNRDSWRYEVYKQHKHYFARCEDLTSVSVHVVCLCLGV